MKNSLTKLFLSTTILASMFSCSSDDDGGTTVVQVTKAAVIENYSSVVYQSYLDSYNGAVTMQTAINAFIDTPSE